MGKEPADPKDGGQAGGVSRREFFSTVGAGAVVAATSCKLSLESKQQESRAADSGDMVAVSLDVNGRRHRLLVEPRWSLLFVLRERLGLTGTKVGCERGECGACTVLVDDAPRYACLTLAVEAQARKITTVEGLMRGEQLGPVQQAFLEKDAFQCGYCTPGQIMAVEGLLRAKANPSLDEIRQAVSGNLCRCGAYPNIFRAAERAAALRSGKRGG